MMAQERQDGERRTRGMTPEERETAVRKKAAELQPNAEPEMQLVLYAEALLDAIVEGGDCGISILPSNWYRGEL